MQSSNISIVDLNAKSKLAHDNIDFRDKLNNTIQDSSQQFVIGAANTSKNNMRRSRNSIIYDIQNKKINCFDSNSNKSEDQED